MPHSSKGSVEAEIRSLYKDRNKWSEATAIIEFKSGKDGLPKSIWESYSAFANTNGGYIVVGACNNGAIEGIDGKAERYREEFVNILSNGKKCSYTGGAEGGNIAIVELERHEVLVIRVRAAEVGQKPVYLDDNIQKSFIRCLEGDRRCTPQELSQMIRDRDVVSSHYTADADILHDTGIEDLDETTIRQYREDMLRARANHAWGEMDDTSLLMKLGAYRRDRKTGVKGLTLAGLLMFGRTEAIMELHPRYKLDFFEYDGSEKFDSRQRWADRVTVDGTWEANLYQFYKRVWPRLTADLKRPFRLSADMKRQDDSTAHEAVREALANAIIHADYLLDGGIQIFKRPDELELVNAGSLLLTQKEIFEGGNSRCRNRNLQKMFKLAGIVDEAGTGVDKITRGWFEQFLSVPALAEDRLAARVSWILPYTAMLSKVDMAAQRAYLGSEKYASLSAREKIILLLIPGDRYVSNSELRQYIPKLHAVDLGRVLSKFRDAGYLESKGRSNAMKYTLSAPLTRFMREAHLTDGAKLHEDASSVLNRGRSSVLNGESSILNAGSSVLNGESAVSGMPEALSREVNQLVQELGLSAALCAELLRYREKRRHTRQVTDEMVIKLCQGRYITLPQLSVLLDRGASVLRRDCIAALVRHGRLVHKEEKLTHKDQAYTSAGASTRVVK